MLLSELYTSKWKKFNFWITFLVCHFIFIFNNINISLHFLLFFFVPVMQRVPSLIASSWKVINFFLAYFNNFLLCVIFSNFTLKFVAFLLSGLGIQGPFRIVSSQLSLIFENSHPFSPQVFFLLYIKSPLFLGQLYMLDIFTYPLLFFLFLFSFCA